MMWKLWIAILTLLTSVNIVCEEEIRNQVRRKREENIVEERIESD